MTQPPMRSLLEAIAGRTGLIECLIEGVTDKRELEQRLSKSRSTINRWLSDLRDADVITSNNHGHQLTVVGRLAYQEYDRFEHQFSAIFAAKPLLVNLPNDVEFDTRILTDAEVLISHEIAPLEPVHRLEDMVTKSQIRTVQWLSPVVLPRYIEFFHQQIVCEGLEVDFVLEADVMDYLFSAYRDEAEDILNISRGKFYRVADGLPYGLAVVDNAGVWVGIYEPGGGLRGAIINTSSGAIEWGQAQFERVKLHADPMKNSDLLYRGARS